jgi:hypothetical protein
MISIERLEMYVYIGFMLFYSAMLSIITFFIVSASIHFNQPSTALYKIWKYQTIYTPEIHDDDLLILIIYVMYGTMLLSYAFLWLPILHYIVFIVRGKISRFFNKI